MNSRVLLFISKGVSYVGTKKAILICFEFVYFEVHGIKALFQYFTLGKLTKRRTSNKKMYVYKNKEIKKKVNFMKRTTSTLLVAVLVVSIFATTIATAASLEGSVWTGKPTILGL